MQREDLLRRFRDDMGWTPSEHNLDLAETLKANISKDVADMLIRSTFFTELTGLTQ